MRNAQEFSNRITSWGLTSESVKPHLADMPQVQPLLTELDALIPDARSLDTRMELARSQARDLTKQRHDIEKQGENLRRRIASHLRGTFGFTSDQLGQFGINPRPRTIRRKQQPAAATDTPPATTTTAK
ncbi:MAG: hypothetical protein WAM82_01375 [Thermoanaerobaculia bacterium]